MGKLPSHVFVVRHGNRLDAADKKWHLTSPTPYDPPLTYSGFLQARQVGNKIASILEQAKIDSETSTTGTTSKTRRKRFKVVIHSSPFLRCAQTSIGISSGLAQTSADSAYIPSDIIVPRAPLKSQVNTQTSHFKSSLLRLDSFLGEWLTPEYFEMITPPPGPALMLGGAKADLLRREDYSAYTEVAAQEPAPAVASPVSPLWNASPVLRPESASRTPSSDKDDPLNVSGLAGALPSHLEDKEGYVAPRPLYPVSSGGKIPEGFVAHARDSCVTVDYQWDSMRAPLDFGDGGKLGEEWTSMHQRFRSGLKKLVNFYETDDSPADLVSGSTANDSEDSSNGDYEEDVENVIIIVSHGAGCNALIGAITYQPVLMDVAIASITLATRKPGLQANSPTADVSLRVDQMYDIQLSATTEHLRSVASHASSRSISGNNTWTSTSRGRTSTLSSLGGPVMSPFTYSNPFSSVGGRSTSANATAPSPVQREPEPILSVKTPPPESKARFAPETFQVSEDDASNSIQPVSSLWTPVHSSLRLIDENSGDEDSDDYDSMFPNFDQSRFQTVVPETPDQPPASASTTSYFHDFSSSSLAVSSPGTSTSYAVSPGPSKGPSLAGPIKLQTNWGPGDPVEEVVEEELTLPQLGGGVGGLWGLPLAPSEAERFRDLSHTKRRWTVNERA